MVSSVVFYIIFEPQKTFISKANFREIYLLPNSLLDGTIFIRDLFFHCSFLKV